VHLRQRCGAEAEAGQVRAWIHRRVAAAGVRPEQCDSLGPDECEQAVLGNIELVVKRLVDRVALAPLTALLRLLGSLQRGPHGRALRGGEKAGDVLERGRVLLVRVPAAQLQLVQHSLCADGPRLSVVHDECTHEWRHQGRQRSVLRGERGQSLVQLSLGHRRSERATHASHVRRAILSRY
jgi:hypothetical protein